MPQAAESLRRFSVHARHVDRHHARVVEEASYEAAAVAYVEDFHPPLGAEREISVIVRDLADGHEQCFRIDLDSGETAPRGGEANESPEESLSPSGAPLGAS
jgi:hypothetical protein